MLITADLHTHTIASDGALTPYELLRKAKQVGLETISITDHDTVNSLSEAVEYGHELQIQVVPGIELSATLNGVEVHILGYFIDYRNEMLKQVLTELRQHRFNRAEKIVHKLNKMNIPLKMESVLEHAGDGSIGRPHIATALVNNGHAESYHQAFSKYIGEGRPAFEKKFDVSPEDIIQLIAEASGLSFLAHPGRALDDQVLFRLIESGLDGIEVIHPSHTPELVRHYQGIAGEYYLLTSGGSDFHGGLKQDDHALGQYGVSAEIVDIMRRRLIIN